MKIFSLLTIISAVYCSGKDIRIVSTRIANGITPVSVGCDVTISNKGTGEKLDLHCSNWGYGLLPCNTESKDSSYGNYDARIMECYNNGWTMYAKVAVWDKVGQYMAIKEFRGGDFAHECDGPTKIKMCVYNFVIDEYWPEA